MAVPVERTYAQLTETDEDDELVTVTGAFWEK